MIRVCHQSAMSSAMKRFLLKPPFCHWRSFVKHCLFVDLARSCMVLYLKREESGCSEQRLFLLVLRKMAHSAARQQRSSVDAAARLSTSSSRVSSYPKEDLPWVCYV